jgi:hypothetical protein
MRSRNNEKREIKLKVDDINQVLNYKRNNFRSRGIKYKCRSAASYENETFSGEKEQVFGDQLRYSSAVFFLSALVVSESRDENCFKSLHENLLHGFCGNFLSDLCNDR